MILVSSDHILVNVLVNVLVSSGHLVASKLTPTDHSDHLAPRIVAWLWFSSG